MLPISKVGTESTGGKRTWGSAYSTTPVESPKYLLAACTLADCSQRANHLTMITLASKEMNH